MASRAIVASTTGAPAPRRATRPATTRSLGSGGTCAGLLAGVHAQAMETRVRGALVVENPMARALVMLEEFTGVMYIALVVSRLIGLAIRGK